MSYYQRPMGDYKTGGYAAGDPGFLSNVWKGIKKIAPAIIGGFIGGPGGALIAQGAANGGPRRMALPSIPGTVGGSLTFPGGTSIGTSYTPSALTGGARRLPPYTATGPGVMPYGGTGVSAPPSGYHYAKDGSGRIVRNRRMNVANPRALRRSMRRVQGFEKLAKRTIQFTRRTRMKKRSSS